MNIDEAYTQALTKLKEKYGKTYDTGEIIMQEGERDPHIMFIVSGLVEVFLGGGNNRDVLWTLEGGEILGEMSLLDQLPRTASAQALTPCEMVRLDKESFYHLVSRYPALSIKVIQLMGTRMRKMDAQYKIRTGYRR
jgi:CRP-like cAMP-binding protein